MKKIIIVLFMILLLVSCVENDDKNENNNNDDDNEISYTWRPEVIPRSSSPFDRFPLKTDLVIDHTLTMDDIENFAVQFKPNGWLNTDIYKENNSYVQYDFLYANVLNLNQDHFYGFLQNGSISENEWVNVTCNDNSIDQLDDTPINQKEYDCYIKNPLDYKPIYLQIGHYYKITKQATTQKNSGAEVSEEKCTGSNLTTAESFTKTLSTETTISGGASWKGMSASFSKTTTEAFSSTNTYETAFSETNCTTSTMKYVPSGESGSTLHATWQRVEVFQYVDKDGNPWDVSDFGFELKTIGENGIFGFESFDGNSYYNTEDYYPEGWDQN